MIFPVTVDAVFSPTQGVPNFRQFSSFCCLQAAE